MYSRSYLGNATERPAIPENYDGVAFSESNTPPPEPQRREIPVSVPTDGPSKVSDPASANPWEKEPPPKVESGDGGILSVFGRMPLFKGIGDIFGFSGHSGALKLPQIGTEEILIIGAALFLFFSKDGDNQCALMLLLLLLIN